MLGVVLAASGWLVVSGASAGGTSEAAAAAPTDVGIAAVVGADGVSTSPPGGWAARRIGDGRYELSFPQEVALSIRSWERPAGVTVRPVSASTWIVTFDDGAEPVDTAFTFLAVPAGD